MIGIRQRNKAVLTFLVQEFIIPELELTDSRRFRLALPRGFVTCGVVPTGFDRFLGSCILASLVHRLSRSFST